MEQVIKQFNSLQKNKYKLIKFDVIKFYPSINESLISKSLIFAKFLKEITQNAKKAVKKATKSILFKEDQIWTKTKKQQ